MKSSGAAVPVPHRVPFFTAAGLAARDGLQKPPCARARRGHGVMRARRALSRATSCLGAPHAERARAGMHC